MSDEVGQKESFCNDRVFLVDMIQSLVEQSCGTDSMAISTYAEAMRFLANEGRCKIVREYGRRVFIEWLQQHNAQQDHGAA
jgi:hypothetical protein